MSRFNIKNSVYECPLKMYLKNLTTQAHSYTILTSQSLSFFKINKHGNSYNQFVLRNCLEIGTFLINFAPW